MTLDLLVALASGLALGAVAYFPLASLGSKRWVPAAFRAAAVAILALLLLDPLLPAGRRARPLVLLDASLSLAAAGGQWARAVDTALGLGEVRLVGDDSPRTDTAATRGTSRLAPALRAAAAVGRRSAADRLLGSLQVDIAPTRVLLGWTPPVSVDEGLRRAALG